MRSSLLKFSQLCSIINKIKILLRNYISFFQFIGKSPFNHAPSLIVSDKFVVICSSANNNGELDPIFLVVTQEALSTRWGPTCFASDKSIISTQKGVRLLPFVLSLSLSCRLNGNTFVVFCRTDFPENGIFKTFSCYDSSVESCGGRLPNAMRA